MKWEWRLGGLGVASTAAAAWQWRLHKPWVPQGHVWVYATCIAAAADDQHGLLTATPFCPLCGATLHLQAPVLFKGLAQSVPTTSELVSPPQHGARHAGRHAHLPAVDQRCRESCCAVFACCVLRLPVQVPAAGAILKPLVQTPWKQESGPQGQKACTVPQHRGSNARLPLAKPTLPPPTTQPTPLCTSTRHNQCCQVMVALSASPTAYSHDPSKTMPDPPTLPVGEAAALVTLMQVGGFGSAGVQVCVFGGGRPTHILPLGFALPPSTATKRGRHTHLPLPHCSPLHPLHTRQISITHSSSTHSTLVKYPFHARQISILRSSNICAGAQQCARDGGGQLGHVL